MNISTLHCDDNQKKRPLTRGLFLVILYEQGQNNPYSL